MDALLVQLLRQAVDLDAERRDRFVDAAFPDDPARRQRLRELVTAFQDDRDSLATDRNHQGGEAHKTSVPSWVPQAHMRVGAFRLLKPLGAGGMGVVWLAERDDGFQQRVAVKLLHAHLSAASRERFQRERSVLARLEHPAIARILDGGEQQGQLWYAMEYIDGVAIDAYARTQGLNLDQRLQLFRELCAVVHAAHQQLIVHRDLKPANVMVNAAGQIKLLDFGIAKLLDGSQTLTESQAPMTIAYAAPEQVRGDAVSTATDIYALGVILFELLTGQRPHESALSALDAMQRITETDPDPPSLIATRCLQVPPVAPRLLSGDLDTIALKALDRDPERRYGSAMALADDLRRFQQGLPIEARPDSTAYRWRKLLVKHRWSVGLVAAAILVVVLGLSLALLSSQREAAALREAAVLAEANEQSREFMVSLFAAAAPEQNLGQAVTALALLDQGWQRLQQERLDPDTLAQIALSIGESFYGLGEMAKARDAYLLALNRLGAQQSARHIDLNLRLASVDAELAQMDSARTRVEQSLAMAERLGDPTLQRRGLRVLGFIERDAGHFATSGKALRQALALVPMPDAERAALLNSLAFTEALAGNAAAAEDSFNATRALLVDLPDAHPGKIWLDYTEGDSWRKLGQLDRAKPLLQRASATVQDMQGQGEEIKRVLAQAEVALQLAAEQTVPAELLQRAGLDRAMAKRINLPELEVRLMLANAATRASDRWQSEDNMAALQQYCIAHFGEAQPVCRR